MSKPRQPRRRKANGASREARERRGGGAGNQTKPLATGESKMIVIKHLNRKTAESLMGDLKAALEATEPMSRARPDYVIDISAQHQAHEKPIDLILYGIDDIKFD